MNQAEARLRRIAGPDGHLDPALFISDPVQGDQIILGRTGDQLSRFPLPDSAEGHEFTTVGELLGELDFEAYEGDDPGFTTSAAVNPGPGS